MKRILKKGAALVLAGAMVCSLAACGGNAGSGSGESGKEGGTAGKKCTIGVAFYTDTGKAVDATKAFLEGVSDTLNAEFKYTVLTQTDESVNLTKIQELISAGADGIICTMDMGMPAIMEECEAAGVYLGGYIGDYNTSYETAYDKVFENEYFVGTSADGACSDDLRAGKEFADNLISYNESHPDEPLTHVSLAAFPAWAFASVPILIDQFMDAIEEYNKTAETPITVDPLDEETDVLNFAPMDSTYFAKHPDSQAIMSFAAGNAFVYPTMVSAGVEKEIKLFTVGYDGGEEANFGTAGTGTLQATAVTAPETIIYPLVLLLNKINDSEFSDQPENAERISTPQLNINSDEALEKFEKSLFYTADIENAMYTPEEVLNMTSYANPDATYADLVDTINKMSLDNVK